VVRARAHLRGGVTWRQRRRGNLTVLSGGGGGWWMAAALVRSCGTDEGRRSLGTSQMKKIDM
jgi:hypothetical protein